VKESFLMIVVAEAKNDRQQDKQGQYKRKLVEIATVKNAAHVVTSSFVFKPLVLTSIRYGFSHRGVTGKCPFLGVYYSEKQEKLEDTKRL
jgi:hypothetical protein